MENQHGTMEMEIHCWTIQNKHCTIENRYWTIEYRQLDNENQYLILETDIGQWKTNTKTNSDIVINIEIKWIISLPSPLP